MTVSYTAEVATCKGFGCFLKLLFRWKGSIYKLVWPDLFFFLGAYFALNLMYRFFLDSEQQKVFELVCVYCEKYSNLIPVSFVLGFYVSIVVGRWWDQYKTIPWPDPIAVYVSASIHGQDEKGRMMRRTIMRYCCLSLTMCFTLISARVKKRFPSLDHLIEAGLLLENEKIIMEDLDRNVPGYTKTWLPVVWAASIVTRARKEGKISYDFAVKSILDELNAFRGQCGLLISYDWISVPLVYTQVVTLAVYTYFLSCVMGRQWLYPNHAGSVEGKETENLDLVFPVFTVLQFFFYMGWLKVAESLLNPFGDDDDDFELGWLVDRNLQVSYLIVDEMHHEHPELLKDQYWDEVFPQELPHTVASEQYYEPPPAHSTDKIKVSKCDGEILSPPSVKLDELSASGVKLNKVHKSKNGRPSPSRNLDIPNNNQAGQNYKDIGRRVSRAASGSRVGFGSISSRRDRTSSVRSSASQGTLAESISGKLSRAGSIASVFRRMLSRERDPNHSSTFGLDGRDNMGSMTNVPRNVVGDVIEELDENMATIISMRPERKPPTVHEIFGSTPKGNGNGSAGSSARIPIPFPANFKNSREGAGLISGSAPPMTSWPFPTEAESLQSASSESPMRRPLSRDAESVQSTNAPLSGDEDEADLERSPGHLLNLEADESMDDIKLTTTSPLTGDKFASRIAKTFGYKERKAGEDKKCEEHLLGNVSGSSEKSDTNQS